jgi:hypothetical protein
MTPLEASWARRAGDSAAVGISGLGRVGLPRAADLVRAGFGTTGIAAATATTALGVPLARGADAGRCLAA